MIHVNLKDGLGNKMFQYSLGRILAEGLGYKLSCAAIREFPATDEVVEGSAFEGPEIRMFSGWFDIPTMLADRRPRRILLDGHFQNYRYYRPHRDRIRKWYANSFTQLEAAPETIVHVRRGDYIDVRWDLPFSYYSEAIERHHPRGERLWIATDDAADPFFKRFERWHPSYIPGGALETIMRMSKARRLIMSRSSFSWWATFLGDQEKVVCPRPDGGFWGPNERKLQSIDLIEEDRFLCVDCVDRAPPTREEQAHQFKRRLHSKPLARRIMGLNPFKR